MRFQYIYIAHSIFRRSGRWRSEYIIDLNENKVTGKILVNVHYYEQGNVSQAVGINEYRTHTLL